MLESESNLEDLSFSSKSDEKSESIINHSSDEFDTNSEEEMKEQALICSESDTEKLKNENEENNEVHVFLSNSNSNPILKIQPKPKYNNTIIGEIYKEESDKFMLSDVDLMSSCNENKSFEKPLIHTSPYSDYDTPEVKLNKRQKQEHKNKIKEKKRREYIISDRTRFSDVCASNCSGVVFFLSKFLCSPLDIVQGFEMEKPYFSRPLIKKNALFFKTRGLDSSNDIECISELEMSTIDLPKNFSKMNRKTLNIFDTIEHNSTDEEMFNNFKREIGLESESDSESSHTDDHINNPTKEFEPSIVVNEKKEKVNRANDSNIATKDIKKKPNVKSRSDISENSDGELEKKIDADLFDNSSSEENLERETKNKPHLSVPLPKNEINSIPPDSDSGNYKTEIRLKNGKSKSDLNINDFLISKNEEINDEKFISSTLKKINLSSISANTKNEIKGTIRFENNTRPTVSVEKENIITEEIGIKDGENMIKSHLESKKIMSMVNSVDQKDSKYLFSIKIFIYKRISNLKEIFERNNLPQEYKNFSDDKSLILELFSKGKQNKNRHTEKIKLYLGIVAVGKSLVLLESIAKEINNLVDVYSEMNRKKNQCDDDSPQSKYYISSSYPLITYVKRVYAIMETKNGLFMYDKKKKMDGVIQQYINQFKKIENKNLEKLIDKLISLPYAPDPPKLSLNKLYN